MRYLEGYRELVSEIFGRDWFLKQDPEQFDEDFGVVMDAMIESLHHEREEAVIRYRFFQTPPRTLESIAVEFDVTRERIRQIQAKALRKLRHPYRSKPIRNFLDRTKAELFLELHENGDRYVCSERERRLLDSLPKKWLERWAFESDIKRALYLMGWIGAEDVSLDDLVLNNRPHNILAKADLTTLNLIARQSESDLLSLDGFGIKCLEEVRGELSRFLIGLRADEDES